MMNERGKSDSLVVPVADGVERRRLAKANLLEGSTCRTQCRERVICTRAGTPDRASLLEVRAGCGKSARPDLCGGGSQELSLPRPHLQQFRPPRLVAMLRDQECLIPFEILIADKPAPTLPITIEPIRNRRYEHPVLWAKPTQPPKSSARTPRRQGNDEKSTQHH